MCSGEGLREETRHPVTFRSTKPLLAWRGNELQESLTPFFVADLAVTKVAPWLFFDEVTK